MSDFTVFLIIFSDFLFFFYFFGIFWIFSDFFPIFLNERLLVQNTWNALNLFIFSQSNDSNSFIARSTGFAESVGRAGRDGSVRSAGRAQLEGVGQTSPEWSIWFGQKVIWLNSKWMNQLTIPESCLIPKLGRWRRRGFCCKRRSRRADWGRCWWNSSSTWHLSVYRRWTDPPPGKRTAGRESKPHRHRYDSIKHSTSVTTSRTFRRNSIHFIRCRSSDRLELGETALERQGLATKTGTK